MATTRAETRHTNRPAISWGLSVVNRIKGRARKHKEKMPLLKILIAALCLAGLMLIYVKYVNEASTYGYFYKVESQKLDSIEFEYNLVKLDVLEYQQKIRNQANNFDAWSDPAALRDRLIVVDTSRQIPILPSEGEDPSRNTE